MRRDTIAAIRFGYGFRPNEIPPDGPEALLTQVRRGAAADPRFATDSQADRAGLLEAARNVERRLKKFDAQGGDQEDRAALEETRRKRIQTLKAAYFEDAHRRIAQAVLSPNGFYERLATFWTNHFNVSQRERVQFAQIPHFADRAIRANVAGSFTNMLTAAATHPAMLVYLTQIRSIGPNSPVGKQRGRGLNENLAREVMELHTLGVDGGYTQQDVTELARLLTGLSYDKHMTPVVFPRRAEPGVKTVLGRRYGARGKPHDMADIRRALADLAAHPATAAHVCRKIARHFIADDPPPEAAGALETAWRRSEGDLGAVYRALVEHPATWERFGDKVKTPFDFLISALRAAGVREKQMQKPRLKPRNAITLGSLGLLGQPLWRAPAPDGWPDAAEEWITPQGLGARLDWSGRAGRRLAQRAFAGPGVPTDPRGFLDAALDDAARPVTRQLVAGAAERWEGFALVLASPEFNRR